MLQACAFSKIEANWLCSSRGLKPGIPWPKGHTLLCSTKAAHERELLAAHTCSSAPPLLMAGGGTAATNSNQGQVTPGASRLPRSPVKLTLANFRQATMAGCGTHHLEALEEVDGVQQGPTRPGLIQDGCHDASPEHAVQLDYFLDVAEKALGFHLQGRQEGIMFVGEGWECPPCNQPESSLSVLPAANNTCLWEAHTSRR